MGRKVAVWTGQGNRLNGWGAVIVPSALRDLGAVSVRTCGGALGSDSFTSRQLDAAAKLRESRGSGAVRCALLHACAVEDQSWRRLGQRLGVAGTCGSVSQPAIELVMVRPSPV